MIGVSNRVALNRCAQVIVCTVCTMASATLAAGAERHVVVNGKQIADAQLERLDRADCREIPDGSYWLNRRSGNWGYAGERLVQGRIGDGCRTKKRVMPKLRSIAPPASEPASAGSMPDDVVKREEPITGTSPLLSAPGSDPDKP
jgi:hypothetical protein